MLLITLCLKTIEELDVERLNYSVVTKRIRHIVNRFRRRGQIDVGVISLYSAINGNLLIDLLQSTSLRYLSTITGLALAYIYEEGYLIPSGSKEAINLGWFYRDPTCGIIDKNNQWAIMAGTHRFVLRKGGVLHELPFNDTHDMRQQDDANIEILTDLCRRNALFGRLMSRTRNLTA